MTNVNQPARPFTGAVTDWFATKSDLNHIFVLRPHPDLDAVEMEFRVGAGTLHGYTHAAGISISASWKGECWDLLLDRDVVAVCGPDGWFCSLCPADVRSHFPSIESLWEDHLFQPLRDWVTIQLILAKAIGLYGGDGITWAKLITDEQVDDPPVHIVQLAQSTA